MLEAGLDPGLWGQLQVLGQELLLAVVFLPQALDLSAQGLQLGLVAPLLGLQLGLQQPMGGRRETTSRGGGSEDPPKAQSFRGCSKAGAAGGRGLEQAAPVAKAEDPAAPFRAPEITPDPPWLRTRWKE